MSHRLVDAVVGIAGVPVPVVVTDLAGTVVVWNDAATRLYGWEPEEAVGRNVGELTVPPGRAEQASLLMDRVRSGEGWSGPFPVMTKDGGVVEVSVANGPVRVDGETVGIVGISMATGASDWQLLIDHATDALSVHDSDGTYRYASRGYHELLGMEPASLVGVDPYTLFHPEDLDDVHAAHGQAFRGAFSVQHRIRRADGTYRWIESTGRGVPEAEAIVVVARAVGDRLSMVQNLEQQRQVAEHLAQLEQDRTRFLTTVAHRARHPVTIVQGAAELFASVMEQGSPEQMQRVLRDLLPRLVANAGKLSELIEQVTHSDLLTREAVQLRSRPFRLEPVVRTAAGAIIARDGPLTVEVPGDLSVHGDPEQLELAIEALVHNAVAHTPIGTAIWVRAEEVGGSALVSVEDAGPGVPDGRKTAIFEAFGHVDDADPDPGLGLGLHMVAEIAALHGGHAWVEDRPGGGAAFKLRLPTSPRTIRYTHHRGSVSQHG